MLRGIREKANDLDLCITQNLHEYMKNKFKVTKKDSEFLNLYQILDLNLEYFVNPKNEFTCKLVDKYYLEDINRMIDFKKKRGNVKDIEDIKKLEEYLKYHPEEI